MLDLYLSDKYKHHWDEIVRLAHIDDEASRKLLRAYALEGVRLSTQSFGLFRHVAEDITIEENGKEHKLKPGDEVFVNLVLPRHSCINYRSAQIWILLLSQIHQRSTSIVPKVPTWHMGGVRIVALDKKLTLLRILRFCAHSHVFRNYAPRLDPRDN